MSSSTDRVDPIENNLPQTQTLTKPEELERSLSSDCSPATLHEHGKDCEAQGKFGDAIEYYQRAIAIDPAPPFWVYRHLGFSLSQQGQSQEAIAAYRQAIELQPEEAASYGLLGQAQEQTADLEGAIASYQTAIQLNPESPVWVYLNLGSILEQCDRIEEAIAAYQVAQQQEPDNRGITRLLEGAQFKLTPSQVTPSHPNPSQVTPSPSSKDSIKTSSETSIETPSKAPIVLHPVHPDLILIQRQQPEIPSSKESDTPDSCSLKIRVSRPLLTELYTAAIALFITPADRPFIETLQPLSGIAFYQFHFDAQHQSGVITPLDRNLETDLVELEWAPMFCHGFLAASEAGRTQLEPLVNWWSQRVPPDQLPPILACRTQGNPTELRAAFWELMFHQTARETEAIATRLSALQKQYMELRSIHETMHNSFAAIEGFLSQAKLPTLQLTFESQPTPKNIVLEPGVGTGQIEQWLPVPSRGLAALEFHVGQCSPHARGQLKVSIHSREEATCLAQWHIPYEHLTPGWFQLDLPAIDIGRKQEVAARIEWNTRIGPAPHVSLTQTQPIREAQIRVNHQILDRSLALRLWTGLPGSRRSFSPYSTMEETETAQLANFAGGHLGQRTLSRLVEVTPNLPTDDFLHIQILENGQKILTHPRQQDLTLAKLPFCCPVGATVVKATVATENAQASTIEYGMALVKEGESAIACFQNNDPAAAIAFSGWIPVKPETPRQITLSLPNAANEAYHIVFGTRSPDCNIQFGWAHWLDFHIS